MSSQDQDRLTAAPDGRPMEDQPQWRRDFPIDWPQDEYVSRRELVKFMTLTSLAFAAGQVWLVVREAVSPMRGPWPRLPIADLDEVPVGGSKVFSYPVDSAPRLLVRTGEASFVAYDQQCTHLLCPVIPAVEQGELHCPCHHGVFDLETGRPLAGPPRRPLARVNLDVREGKVWATGMQGGETALSRDRGPEGAPEERSEAGEAVGVREARPTTGDALSQRSDAGDTEKATT